MIHGNQMKQLEINKIGQEAFVVRVSEAFLRCEVVVLHVESSFHVRGDTFFEGSPERRACPGPLGIDGG